jgi:CheY-like chemotaxis protein
MSEKVLYAEDEFTNRKLLEIQLKNIGIQCDLAGDGMEAVRLFKENAYDLVILDQFMPGMNGDEAAKIIRSISPDIPLIAITSDDGEIPVLRQAGFQEIFIKPLRGKDHIDIIKKHLARKEGKS